jgi:hypothetical protein
LTTLNYNSAGLVERIADPFGRQALSGYDNEKNLISLTDAVGYATQVERAGLDDQGPGQRRRPHRVPDRAVYSAMADYLHAWKIRDFFTSNNG